MRRLVNTFPCRHDSLEGCHFVRQLLVPFLFLSGIFRVRKMFDSQNREEVWTVSFPEVRTFLVEGTFLAVWSGIFLVVAVA